MVHVDCLCELSANLKQRIGGRRILCEVSEPERQDPYHLDLPEFGRGPAEYMVYGISVKDRFQVAPVAYTYHDGEWTMWNVWVM